MNNIEHTKSTNYDHYVLKGETGNPEAILDFSWKPADLWVPKDSPNGLQFARDVLSQRPEVAFHGVVFREATPEQMQTMLQECTADPTE